MVNDEDGIQLKTTKTSLKIIEKIQELDGATVRQLSDHFNLSKTAIHKHISTLESMGYLQREGEIYQVGLTFLHLGMYSKNRMIGSKMIDKKVTELSNLTSEESDFGVLNNSMVLIISEEYHTEENYLSSYQPDSFTEHAGVGSYYHLHTTAIGKAILAELEDNKIDNLISGSLVKNTEHTITEKDEFIQEIDRVRNQGYAIDDEEFAEGLVGVGKSVKKSNGGVIGAISVTGPKYRLQNDKIQQNILPNLDKIVHEIEKEWHKDAINSI